MAFATFRPGPPLAPLIETIWDWDAPAAAHRFERILSVARMRPHSFATRLISRASRTRTARAASHRGDSAKSFASTSA